MTDFFKGKKILITQNDIYSINGSSVIVLELADFLRKAGASVIVYTYFLHEPLKSIFADKKILVTESEDELSLSNFDYIWVHHQVLPLSIIKELDTLSKKSKTPIFIFNHMSSLGYIADEFPYIWNLENSLSSLSLFNSQETLDAQISMLNVDIPKKLYQNPAPNEYLIPKKKSRNRLKRLLVVSNHPPNEINNLRTSLSEHSVVVDFLGENSEKVELISPKLLNEYDVVVTIGKTVQNCIVAGIPVYLYDHFGGPGYLNKDNFSTAEDNNFSGRGFSHKNAEEITSELINHYHDADQYIRGLSLELRKRFTVDNLAASIFSSARPRNFQIDEKAYIKYLEASHIYSREHRRASRYRVVLEGELRETGERSGLCEEELIRIKKSKAYALSNIIMNLLRRIKVIIIGSLGRK